MFRSLSRLEIFSAAKRSERVKEREGKPARKLLLDWGENGQTESKRIIDGVMMSLKTPFSSYLYSESTLATVGYSL